MKIRLEACFKQTARLCKRLVNVKLTRPQRCFQSTKQVNFPSDVGHVTSEIERITEVSSDHMTPEIKLRLITPNCPLWHDRGDNSPFCDPFWAFYWPGGQVLTRFILDNPAIFANRKVLDVGSGCGASAIACKLVGAKSVTANDIDPVALEAIKLNAKLNNVAMETSSCDMIGQSCVGWDIVVLGDMFYDTEFADQLVPWLCESRQLHKTQVFIGDPGRLPLVNHPIKMFLTKVFQCDLPVSCRLENNGLLSGLVWRLDTTS